MRRLSTGIVANCKASSRRPNVTCSCLFGRAVFADGSLAMVDIRERAATHFDLKKRFAGAVPVSPVERSTRSRLCSTMAPGSKALSVLSVEITDLGAHAAEEHGLWPLGYTGGSSCALARNHELRSRSSYPPWGHLDCAIVDRFRPYQNAHSRHGSGSCLAAGKGRRPFVKRRSGNSRRRLSRLAFVRVNTRPQVDRADACEPGLLRKRSFGCSCWLPPRF
jgi:hypothetical protein